MLKKVISTTLAGVLVFSDTTLANAPSRTPQQLVLDSMAAQQNITNLTLTGDLAINFTESIDLGFGTLDLSDVVFNVSNISVLVSSDPVSQNYRFLASGDVELVLPALAGLFLGETDFSVSGAVFIDNAAVHIYTTETGWMTDPAWDVDPTSLHLGMNLAELEALSLELITPFLDMIPLVFADYSVDGLYVLESHVDNAAVIDILSHVLTADFFIQLAQLSYGIGDMVTYRELIDMVADPFFAEDMVIALDEAVAALEFVAIEALSVTYIAQDTLLPVSERADVSIVVDIPEDLFGVPVAFGTYITTNFTYDFDPAALVFPNVTWP